MTAIASRAFVRNAEALSDNQARFADYLVDCWTGEFRHRYGVTRNAAWSSWRERVGENSEWWCRSLCEAAAHYSWPENTRSGPFAGIAQRLRAAMNAMDPAKTAEACLDVFRWGGVAKKQDDASQRWVRTRCEDGSIVDRVRDAATLLAPGSRTELHRFDGTDLLMNSAMTKVYTAADADGRVVMYDGRVGAALGLLVRRFLEARGATCVPDDLAFRWGAPTTRSAAKQRTRDPSLGTLRFLELPNTSSNARADYIRAEIARATSAVLLHAVQQLASGGVHATMQDLERALFMVGYDVRVH